MPDQQHLHIQDFLPSAKYLSRHRIIVTDSLVNIFVKSKVHYENPRFGIPELLAMVEIPCQKKRNFLWTWSGVKVYAGAKDAQGTFYYTIWNNIKLAATKRGMADASEAGPVGTLLKVLNAYVLQDPEVLNWGPSTF